MQDIAKRRMKWEGHVKRIDKERPAKRWEVEGLRPRGRPQSSWRDGIKRNVRKRSDRRMAANREEWK